MRSWTLTLCSLALCCQRAILAQAPPGTSPVAVATATPRDFAEASRQIHLDFHTSEHIDSIGVDFSREQFQAALRLGRVNAINVFAKGHHGWSYYPTAVGRPHPNLDFDLLGEQIAACRELGVRVYAYYTVGYSHRESQRRPEWAQLDRDGSNSYRRMLAEVGPGGRPRKWEYLEPSGPYADSIYAQLEELVSSYDLDGVWFDIHNPERVSFSAWSLADFAEHGVDTADAAAVQVRTNERYKEFFRRTREIVKRHLPAGTVYYNGTTRTYNSRNVEDFKVGFFEANSKHDLEDLPTAWGGYDIFPWRSKYFANTGKPIVAMSGKFHKAWGEFGGFKTREAMRYEAATMVSFGAACNFGDQLHPRGEMDTATYANVGYAYEYVQSIENYGVGALPIARTGLYVGEDLTAIEGAVNMLLEEQVNFNVVNTLDDWSDIELLVLTSDGVLPRDAERVRDFVARGGRVLTLGGGFLLDGEPLFDIGADYLGAAEYDVDYTVALPPVGGRLVPSPFLNYSAALRLSPKPGTEVLAELHEPYFSRTVDSFSSHRNTPYRLDAAAHPAVIRSGEVVTIAHDLDRQYAREGAFVHRQLFANALDLLRDDPMVAAEMPSQGRLNLLHQPDERRYVAHLTYASPIQRGSVRVIEDIVALRDVAVTVSLPQEVRRAYLVPGMEEVELVDVGGRLGVVLEEVDMHVGLVLEY